MSPLGARLDNVEDVYPLTPLQEGLLFHSIADDDSSVYVDQIVARIEGPLDLARFRRAWDGVIERHAALRTAYLWDGLDEPLQVVGARVELDCVEPDWSEQWLNLDDAARGHHLDDFLAADRSRGFDLARAPLLRLHVWPDDATGWRMILTFHHLIVDGWSTRRVLDEVFAVYETNEVEAAGLPSTMRYRDYVQWLTEQDVAAAEQAWRTELAGFTTPTPLFTPPPGPVGGRAGQQLDHRLDRELTDALRSFAATHRLTLSTIVQGAWAITLGRQARASDVAFGVTVSGRPPTLTGIEQAVGLFINTVPLRAQISEDSTVTGWLGGLQRSRLRLQDHDTSSLADIQRWSDLAPGETLFESIVVFENYPVATDDRSTTRALSLGELHFHEHSNYPLALLVLPGEELHLTLVYDGTRFDESWISILLDDLCLVLERLVDSPDRRLGDLSFVGAADRQRLRASNETSVPAPSARCIHDLIEEAARRAPEHPAVVSRSGAVTYDELDRRANGLARKLAADGIGPSARVGLKVERSADMIVGLLGILKAGAAYVPLDPTYPEARNQAIIDDAGLATVVTADDLPPPTPERPAVDRSGDQTAYVIYTSGSTGRPKGVPVTHRNLVHSTTARDHHYGSDPDRFLLLSSFAFDSSVVGIFWTLCSGGTLVLPAPGQEQDMEALARLIDEHAVTHLLTLPTLYALLLEHDPTRLGSLRVAIVAGEACPRSTVAGHRQAVPTAELHNEYGPTEATVWSTVHRLDTEESDGPVAIGRPIANTRTYVLDRDHRPVPIGFPGELFVGGDGVTAGYLGRDDLSAAAFVDIDVWGDGVDRLYRTGDLVCHRGDGALLYLGRVDAQLKIRGHRIEAGEVETALRELPGVTEAVVVGHDTAPGRTQLVAYVAVDEPESIGDLRALLDRRLPEFMVPSVVVPLTEIPRLPNGKIDTTALPDSLPVGENRGLGVEPRTDVERTLAGLWSELLGVERVHVGDDFFELGGDSIVSIQLLSRARRAGLHLQPSDIARHPTLEALASVAQGSEGSAPQQGIEAGDVPLAPIQQWFFDLDLEVPGHWNQSQLFEVPADTDIDALKRAFQACIDAHPQLRARFERGPGGWRQWVPERSEPAPFVEVFDESALFGIQSGFDLATASPIAGSFWRRADEPMLLLIAVHHLVIDVVSWGVLVDDLAAAYAQAAAGHTIELPPPTSSYRQWAEQQTGRRAAGPTPATALPVDTAADGPGTESTARTASMSLTVEKTTSLMTDANLPYRTTTEDLLVTALVLAIAEWTGSPDVQLEIESHGRPDDLDTSRTIGWFTDASTAIIAVDPEADAATSIVSVKEQLRADRCAASPGTSVGFNYLGRIRQPSTGGLLMPRTGADSTSRAPENRRTHLIDILAAVSGDRLTIDVHYSDERHREATITSLLGRVHDRLIELVEWCSTTDAGTFTPSDFPEAGLDQSELDAFLDDIL